MGVDYSIEHAADLAVNLPRESRVSRKAFPENEWTVTEYMLAGIEYNLAFLAWSKTKDAKSGFNKPKPRKTPAEIAAVRQKVEDTSTDEIDKLLGY